MTAQEIAKALGGKKSGKGYSCRCPAHNDKNPSLSVSDAGDGRVLFKCHAGCSQVAVMDALRDLGLFGGNGGVKVNGHTKPETEETWGPWQAIDPPYSYTDASGSLLYQVCRKERFSANGKKKKSFPQRHPDGNDGWIWEQGEPRVLYRWPELQQFPDATVFVTEGEKDADRVASLGHCATTVANGNWNGVDVSNIAGRDVWILEDADLAGVEKAARAAAVLQPIAKTVRVVRLPGQEQTAEKHGKDVSDWLDEGHTEEELIAVCADAPLWEPSRAAPEELADEFDATPDNPSSEPPPLDVAPWWRDPSTIPRREFLFGQHYVRRTIGATIAAGGRGKTTLGLFEGVSMAIGRDLMTRETLPRGPLRVLCINGEEDQDELDRRVAAICQRYEISQSDLGDRLFVMSVRDRPLRLATMVKNVATLNRDNIAALAWLIEKNGVDVFMLDPWISFHAVNESGNMDMDLVIKEGLGGIATRTNSAGELFHHPGKPKPGQAETSVEDGRGASAILWAVRSARVLNFMTPDEASKLGISEDSRRRHIRTTNGKANMGPVGSAKWMRLEVQNLSNGDEVACASPWSPPNPFDGVTTAQMELARQLARTGAYREDPRSPQWFGFALAPILNIDVSNGADNKPGDVARIKAIIKTWCKNHVLETVLRKDEQRKEKAFIVAGTFCPEREPNPGADLADEEYTLQ